MKTKLTSRISAAALASALICLSVVGINAASAAAAPTSDTPKHTSKVAWNVQARAADVVAYEKLAGDVSPAAAQHLSDGVRVAPGGDLDVEVHAIGPVEGSERADLAGIGASVLNASDQWVKPRGVQSLPAAGVIHALVPAERVGDLDAMSWVAAVLATSEAPPDAGSVQSEGVALHRAATLQAAGVDGTGVKVGVISDGVTNLAASQASGDLPASVNVLSAGSGDEGTAMLEIVHDMAPGASLAFAATGGGLTAHIAAQNNLAAAGMDIITEDIPFDTEPVFQQGAAAQNAETLAGSGGVWISSSSGNLGVSHAPRVLATGTGHGPDNQTAFAGCQNNPTNAVALNGADTTFDVQVPSGASISANLQWSEPRAIFPTAGAGGFTDLDLKIMNSTATTCLASSDNSQGGGAGDTLESAAWTNTGASTATVKLVVSRFGATGAVATPTIDLRWRGGAAVDATTQAGALNPDSNYTGSATSAGAVNAGVSQDPTTVALENYSAGGPIQLSLTTVCSNGSYPCSAANSIAGPAGQTAIAPTYTAADGVQVTGVGGFGSPFYGTSAATPSSAGVAALVLQSLGLSTTPAQLTTALVGHVTDRGTPGADNLWGAGVLDAFSAASSDCAGSDTPEPNDSVAGASVAVSGVAIASKVCSGNDDYFAIEGVAGQSVGALVQFTHTLGDLDVQLFDPSGAVVATSQGTVDNESINFTATLTGLYTVWIYGYQDAANSYTVTLTSVVCPPDDAQEPNDSFASPSAIASGVAVRGITCPADDDYYSFPVQSGDAIDVALAFFHRFGDVDVQLLDGAGTVVASSQGTVDNEAIHYVAATAGSYRVRVYGFSSALNTYRLTVTTVAGAPGAPSAVAGTAGNGQVGLSWTAPANTGGSPISNYQVTVFNSAGGAATGVTGTTTRLTGSTATSFTFTGLTNGTAYTFKVAALNTAGTGPQSVLSSAVTPRTVPGAPSAVAGTAGNGQVGLSWTAPANTGGSPISNYQVTVFNSAGGAATGVTGTTTRLTGSTATSFTFTGLTNGTAYTFKVAALNAAGTGPQSALSSAVTPVASTSAAIVGLVDGGGNAYVRQGLTGAWTLVASGASALSVATDPVHGPLIGVITSTGTWVKQGTLTGPLTKVSGPGASAISVATDATNGPLIGMITADGAWVKRGSLTTAFTKVAAAGATAISVATDASHGPVIGIINATGFWAKQGSLTSAWTHESGAGALVISVATDATTGPVLGLITSAGAWAKQGALTGSFTKLASGASTISVATDATHGPLVGIITATGFWAKQGSLTSAWTHETGAGTTKISVGSNSSSGPVLGLIDGTGSWAKQGALTGSFTKLSGAGATAITTAS